MSEHEVVGVFVEEDRLGVDQALLSDIFPGRHESHRLRARNVETRYARLAASVKRRDLSGVTPPEHRYSAAVGKLLVLANALEPA